MAADEAIKAGKGFLGSLVQQVDPATKTRNGKLSRNLMLTTAFAAIGVGATVATGGAGLPFVLSPTLPAGAGFWGGMGHGVGTYFAAATNGVTATAQQGIAIATGADWGMVGEGLGFGAENTEKIVTGAVNDNGLQELAPTGTG